MHGKYFAKTFKMEDYVIDELEDKEFEVFIHCHAKKRGMWFKGQYSKKMTEERIRRISHMMLENKQVVLLVNQRRFAFKGTRRWEKLPDVEKRKQTTNTFRLHMLRELQRDNYSGSGHKRQMSGMFPMKLLDSLEIKLEWRKGITRVGLDGKGVRKGKLVHHLADLDKGKSICVIPDLKQSQLKKNSWKSPRKTDLSLPRHARIWMIFI
ncbi:hypothetical protein KKG24_05505 [Patescibacteria group bacterium]|nr:hypothetical protein [Patescibacteria group bacterium]MBU0999720.1 hypothetical protein [Patescibacteria group bacterium]